MKKPSFLTQAKIPLASCYKEKIFDEYQWHQKVWSLFPASLKERDFIFSQDQVGECVLLIIVSAQKPKRPKWCPEENWNCIANNEGFFEFDNYRFQLKASPSQDQCNPRKRVSIQDQALLEQWMQRKAQQAGFTIDDDSLSISEPTTIISQKGKKKVISNSVTFSGILKVNSVEKFKLATKNGIGRNKAFGYGLLKIAPIQ